MLETQLASEASLVSPKTPNDWRTNVVLDHASTWTSLMTTGAPSTKPREPLIN